MGSPHLSSRRWIWEQYDHGHGGNTVQRRGGVVRVEHGPKGLAISCDVTPRYCAADPYRGAQAGGGRMLAQSLTAPAPTARHHRLHEFRQSGAAGDHGRVRRRVKGMAEACTALDFPVVSGNVSLYNETNGIAIPPTPAIGGIGVLDLSPNPREHRLQERGRCHFADRRDAGLARPVDLSARHLRTRGGGAAAGGFWKRKGATVRRFAI